MVSTGQMNDSHHLDNKEKEQSNNLQFGRYKEVENLRENN
jgi:hypothetical protein